MALFSGNANPVLAQEIARHLMVPLGRAVVGRFSDGEVNVELMENVRGRDVFIVQPTCPPANDNLMELLLLVDACRRSSAARITAVVPYFGYARQDRRPRATRVAITAKVVANMLAGAGVHRVLTVDLHADQIPGFFDIPVDNVYASPSNTGDAYTLSNGMSKNPWICSACTSTLSNRSTPALAIMFATSLAAIAMRAPRMRRSCRA